MRRDIMTIKENVIFKFGRSYHISHNDKYFCIVGDSAEVRDINTGKMVFKFRGMGNLNSSCFMSNNKLIVKTGEGIYHIYDLLSGASVKAIKPPQNVLGSTGEFFISKDGKYIIDTSYIFPRTQLLIMDIETGDYTQYDLNDASNCRLLHDTENDIYYAVTTKTDSKGKRFPSCVYSFSYSASNIPPRIKFEKIKMKEYNKISHIDHSKGRFAIQAEGKNIITIYDPKTHKETVVHHIAETLTYDIKLSESGKYIAIVDSFLVSVYDIETDECILTFDIDHGCFAEFFDNDSKLLLGSWKNGYCIDLSYINRKH